MSLPRKNSSESAPSQEQDASAIPQLPTIYPVHTFRSLEEKAEQPHYSFFQKGEIYLRATGLGLSKAVTWGTVGAAGGWMGASTVVPFFTECKDPAAVESCFTSNDVISASKSSAVVGAGLLALCGFYRGVKTGVEQGFENGPKSVDPIAPFRKAALIMK